VETFRSGFYSSFSFGSFTLQNIITEEELLLAIPQKLHKRSRETPQMRMLGCSKPHCRFKMRWLKRRGELWELGNHKPHPTSKKEAKRKARAISSEQGSEATGNSSVKAD
jgi:hypothetical protein